MFLLESLCELLRGAWLLALHLSGKNSFPKPLSASEEAEAIRRLSRGDPQAKEDLIVHNLRLVAHIAKKYASSGLDADDLVSIGTIGLIKAVNTFRAEAGKLTSYASRCVENEILMALRADRKRRTTLSLDDPIGSDSEGNEIRIIDLLGSDTDEVPERAELTIESARALAVLDTVLTGREKRVIVLRYGVADGAARPQHEVARILGISRSYVSRIEKQALEKLREAMEQ